MYRAVERLRRVEKLSSFEQMKTYEKIADEFIDVMSFIYSQKLYVSYGIFQLD